MGKAETATNANPAIAACAKNASDAADHTEGCQCLEPGRRQYQSGRQLLHGKQEHQSRSRQYPRRNQRHRHSNQPAERPCPQIARRLLHPGVDLQT